MASPRPAASWPVTQQRFRHAQGKHAHRSGLKWRSCVRACGAVMAEMVHPRLMRPMPIKCAQSQKEKGQRGTQAGTPFAGKEAPQLALAPVDFQLTTSAAAPRAAPSSCAST